MRERKSRKDFACKPESEKKKHSEEQRENETQIQKDLKHRQNLCAMKGQFKRVQIKENSETQRGRDAE